MFNLLAKLDEFVQLYMILRHNSAMLCDDAQKCLADAEAKVQDLREHMQGVVRKEAV